MRIPSFFDHTDAKHYTHKLSKNLTISPLFFKKMAVNNVYVVPLLCSALLLGCDQAKENDVSESQSYAAPAMQSAETLESNDDLANASIEVEKLSNGTDSQLGSSVVDTNVAGKEMVISAEVSFKVKDVVDTTKNIEKFTKQYAGFIESSRISSDKAGVHQYIEGGQSVSIIRYNRHSHMIVRIPKSKVTEFLNAVQSEVVFLNEQMFTAQDVTLDLYRQQLEQQLYKDKSADLSEQRLSQINAESQSGNVASINATYDARKHQEYAKLQKLDIEDRIKYSTINLNFTQPDSVYREVTQSIDAVIEAESPSFIEQVNHAFFDGWKTLKNAIIWMVSTWWFWVILVLLYLIFLAIKAVFKAIIKRINARKGNIKIDRHT